MMAIQKFSKEYYQLIVTLEDDVFVNNIVTVSASRALCQRISLKRWIIDEWCPNQMPILNYPLGQELREKNVQICCLKNVLGNR